MSEKSEKFPRIVVYTVMITQLVIGKLSARCRNKPI